MSIYRDLILELCQGRFARLAKYFEPFDDNDLKIIELEDMIESTEPVEKILMKIFINNLESAINCDPNKKRRYIEGITKPCMTIIKEFNLVYWNIRNKLLSSLSQAYGMGMWSNNKFTIEKGSEFIINTMKGVNLLADMLILLDFSNNGFVDNDVKYLKPLIDEFTGLYPNNEFIIRLRYNNMFYCVKFITELLSKSNIKYIDLCNSNFSIFEHEELYPLTDQDFKKSLGLGYADSGENLKVSTCIASQTPRCHNTYSRLRDNTDNETLFNNIIDKIIFTSKTCLSLRSWQKLIKKTDVISIDERIQATHNGYYSITAQMALDDD